MKAIPHFEEPQLYTEIVPKDSPFVELKDGEFFDVKMKYPVIGMMNSVNECYVRKEVFEMLLEAQKNLPVGYKLRIWDAWRPFALQQELYDSYAKILIKDLKIEDKPFDEQKQIVSKYVSIPVNDTMLPPLHTTGGALDVTLVDEEGRELEMGTEFDEFSPKTATDYYEHTMENNEVRNNRRILYNAMIKAGFTNLPSEWWHYEYGNRVWAYYSNKPAIYKGVFTLDEIYKINGKQNYRKILRDMLY